MRNGEGFLLVYSITSRMSFDEIHTFYHQIRRVKDRDFFPMVLIANKCDLEHDRQVSSHGKTPNFFTENHWKGSAINTKAFFIEGRDLAKSFGCIFIETSAKQRINVDEAFYHVVRDIRRFNKEQQGGGHPGNGYGGQQFDMDEGDKSDKCCGCTLM